MTGQELFEILAGNVRPDEVTLEELMKQWEIFAVGDPWLLQRHEARERLQRYLDDQASRRKTYIIRQDRCEDLIMSCDMGDPTAPICYQLDSPDEWEGTPWQTADVQHNLLTAAGFACDYAQFPFGEDEDGNEIEVQIIDAETGERVV